MKRLPALLSAMAVIYPSPLLVLCDSPQNYRGQPGVEFLRNRPTVWDETVVLEGEIAKSVALDRRSGDKWYLGAMNGDAAAQFQAPLKFLGKGQWALHAFADKTDESDYQAVVESQQDANETTRLSLSLAPAGGFAALLSQSRQTMK